MQTRFKKNILTKTVGALGQQKISDAKILLCGAGGIGSHLLCNLLSLGIHHIGIVERDLVEYSNLNRQIIYTVDDIGKSKAECAGKWALKYSPNIELKVFNLELNEVTCSKVPFDEYDIIVDCFDSKTSVFLLHKIAIKYDKPLITGGVNDSKGFVLTVFPKETDCLNCFDLLREPEHKIDLGVLAPTCSILASAYSFEVLKIILGQDNKIINEPVFFDGLLAKTNKPKVVSVGGKCSICGRSQKRIIGVNY